MPGGFDSYLFRHLPRAPCQRRVTQLQVFTIKVIPSAVNFFETADLVQAMALAIDLEARDELYLSQRVIGPTCFCATYFQAKPMLTLVEPNPAGPG